MTNPGNTEGFDEFSGRRWIYPNNMAIRLYQKQAVEKALFHNSMIVLPTGFGKTFIAAVVMYNFYRWYPQGKIIFVAPTRPLVTQQIVECKKISGIPSSDCIELTGQIVRDRRCTYWTSKRVFFATPQVIENDLEQGILPATQIKCIVIDEAHRAQGGYSYVGIISQLHSLNKDGFRVLALSATPGSDIQRVQQVMQNLLIYEVMFRSENSLDLMQFKNEKSSKAWTVELVGKHREFVDKFISITDPTFKELHRAGLTFNGSSVDKVAKFTLITAMNRCRQNDFRGGNKGRLMHLCCAAISMAQNFELLTLYGIRVFYSSIMRALSEPKSAIRTILAASVEFEKLLSDIREIFGQDLELDVTKKESNCDLLQGHPKLKVVKDLLVQHFDSNKDKTETRAIVFTKYRESVSDIVQTLFALEPMIKPASFVGQAGMKQREQIKLVSEFKAGTFNVLVATCVAEEGLDIGEVDLIICYDTTSSPISTTQRRGRTGRKRSGDVQTILTKGFEEKKLKNASNSRRQIEEQLYKRENYMMVRYHNSPRMVPLNIVPVCLEQKIFPVNDEEPKSEKKKSKTLTGQRKKLKSKEFDEEEEKEGLKMKDKLKEREIEKTKVKSINDSFFSDSDDPLEY